MTMSQQANPPLPAGYVIDNYRIEKQLSVGGFSIVYLARDPEGNPVAIKEYLPAGLALRKEGSVIPQISEEQLGPFRYGMKCFFEEGRALARLSHPNVVRVTNFFRANETVYMVMAYEHGNTLQEYINSHKGGVRESFIRGVFNRLLNGLREVHTNKLLHLDIKPSNIYIRTDGTPVLLDFGAARQTLMQDSPILKPMYTPGFASPEHYHDREQLGPWSDVYSIGASMYACMAGAAPPAADQRLEEDFFEPAILRFQGKYSNQLLETVDWCLRLDHLDRPQSVLSLQKSLIEPADKPVLVAHPKPTLVGRILNHLKKMNSGQ